MVLKFKLFCRIGWLFPSGEVASGSVCYQQGLVVRCILIIYDNFKSNPLLISYNICCSVNWPRGRFSLYVLMSVYVLPCVPSVGDRNQNDWRRLLVKKCIAKNEKNKNPFFWKVSTIFGFFYFFFGFCVLFWQTSLLCMMGKLAMGGSVAVAVGVGNR